MRLSLSRIMLSLCWLCNVLCTTHGKKRTTFSLFVFVPVPDPLYDVGFDKGLSILPAVELAIQHYKTKRAHKQTRGDHNATNPNNAPVLSIRSVSKPSGCEQNSQTVVSLVSTLREYVQGRNNPIAIIGPACSESATFIINTVGRQLSIPVLHTGTSPALSENLEKYPNAFGMISSGDVLVDTLIKVAIMERWDWKNIAVLYDDTKDTYRTTYESLFRQLNNSEQPGYSSRMTSPYISMDDLITKRSIRIVVVIASEELAHELICVAGQRKADFSFPVHQFIFLERTLTDFLEVKEGDTSDSARSTHSSQHNNLCSKETVINALEGAVFLNQALDSVDPDVMTISNYTVGEIREQYKTQLLYYSRVFNQTLLETDIAYAYYDAFWAFILGLQVALSQPKPMFNMSDAILNNVSFQGVSSWIDFSNRQHVTNPVSIHMVKGGIAVKKGQQNGTSLTYEPQTFISDKYNTIYVTPHTAIVALGFLLAIVLLIFTLIMQILTVVYRKSPSLKATSAQLNHFIYLGCYLFMVSLLFNTLFEFLPATNYGSAFCSVNIYTSMLGSCFIFSTILTKSWRIYRIFRHVFRTSRSHQWSLHDATLAVIVLALVLTISLLSIPSIVLTPLRVETTATYDTPDWIPIERVTSKCNIETFQYMLIPLAFLVCIKDVAVILGTLNRRIKREHFRTTKNIVILVYLLTIMWSIGGPLYALFIHLNVSVNIRYTFYSSLLVTNVILCQAMLIVPSLVPVLRKRERKTHQQVSQC